MDFDDLDDLNGSKKELPSKTTKFQPKSSKIKPQLRGKTPQTPPISEAESQNSTPKPEAEESVPEAKSEAQKASVLSKIEDEEDTKPNIDAMEETEAVVSNSGADGMEVDAKEGEQGEEEEDDDPIVREIDVYFNPSIGPDSQLYVMQYPLRPKWRPYELDERCEEVRVKPGTKEVEIDLSIDDSANWDHAQASKFNMTKQTLTSKFTGSQASNYAVGVLIGDKLYLNPIDAVIQLRPSLAHLDSTCDTGAAIKSEEGKPGPSKKQVKGSELEDDQNSEEPWVPLKYHGSKTDISSMYLRKMMTEESTELEFNMNPSDYMKSLCPVDPNDNSKPKRLSKRLLLSLPLEERVKKLFLEGPPIQRFRFISHFAPDATPEGLLAVLRKHGRLVQGLWVANSALLFQDTKDTTKMAARDYILLSFSKKPIVKSSELNLPVKLKEDAKHFLDVFAIERDLFKDWKFKEQKDWEFVKLYKEIELEQEEAWKTTDERLKNYFGNIGKAMRTLSKQSATHDPVKVLNPEKSITKAASGSRAVTKSTISVETREALLKALPKVFQNHKVCKFEVICQGLQELVISQSSLPKSDPKMIKALTSGADAPPEELGEIIGEVAYDIHGSYVLKSSPDHPQYDDFRKVVVDLFLERGSDAKLKKAEFFEAARLALRREISQTEYTKVITELCDSKGSARVLKSGDGKPS